MSVEEKNIVLKPREERRLLAGHPWVFSNEISVMDKDIVPGDIVCVRDSRNSTIGYGYYTLNSLISVRLISRSPIADMREFLRSRITDANDWKSKLLNTTSYRVLFGESDGIPGLIIDRFGSTFVIESLTYWADTQIDTVVGILGALFDPLCIIEKSESSWREIENLPTRKSVLFGEMPTESIRIGDVEYQLDLMEGQKTGFYLDQESNRAAIRKYVNGKRVLDCYCNDGGFALHSALAGAEAVTGVDSSERAIRNAVRNASLNGVAERCRWIKSDVSDFLRVQGMDSLYDVVILDPPSFVKSKKKLVPALKGYQKINTAALSCIADGGILVSCSCSHHVSESLLLEMLHRSAARGNITLQILENRGANLDHPRHGSMPETDYLHCVVCRVQRR